MAAATQESHSNRQHHEENSSSSAASSGAVGDNAMQSLRDAYNKYGAFGTDQFHGNNLTLTNADKWLREAGLFTPNDSAKKQPQQQQQQQISTADTGIVYKQIVGNEGHAMSFEQFCEFLRQLAGRSAGGDGARHGTDVYNDFCAKLAQHAQPQLHDTTRPVTDDANSADNSNNNNKTKKGADGAAPAASDAVIEKEVTERLTDPSGFTGVQKERFNEDGSGKGIAETSADYADRNVKANDGYVQGYKDKDTYDEKH